MPVTALRARALCSGCESRLPPRTDAWWDEETRTATCLSCARAMGLLEVHAPPVLTPDPAPAVPAAEPVPEPVTEASTDVAEPAEPAAPDGDAHPTVAPAAIEPDAGAEPAAIEPDASAEPDAAPADAPEPELPARDALPLRGVVRPLRPSTRPPQSSSGTVIRRRTQDPSAEPAANLTSEPGTDDGTGSGAAATDRRPPLPPREQVTALRPSRKPTSEPAAGRRFPSEGATAIEAEEQIDPAADEAAADEANAAPPTPPLRRADALPPDDDAEDGATDGTDADGEAADGTEPEPRHVQSAADLIGRLRAVQRTTVRPAPRRGPLVVERPEAVADRGEIDDTRVTQTLEAARIHGVEVLHHRPVAADREIDHLVIAVNGIWTVVEQEKLTGPLDKRDLGDWFTADARLFIGDEDRTDLIESARAQAEAVRLVLADGPFATVPVRPVVCFGTVPPGWVREPFVVGGVSVTWRNHLVEPMLDPVLLDRDARHQLIELLVAAGT